MQDPVAPASERSDLTQLLLRWNEGVPGARDALVTAVHSELHRLAKAALRRERPGHTLQATALVNEAYLKLVDQRQVDWQGRAHFFGAAAKIMRRILVDHARGRAATKRGGADASLTLTEAFGANRDEGIDVLALNEALEHLAGVDARQSRLVELRFFGGLSIHEAAQVLGISVATVKREWYTARMFLRRELAGPPPDGG